MAIDSPFSAIRARGSVWCRFVALTLSLLVQGLPVTAADAELEKVARTVAERVQNLPADAQVHRSPVPGIFVVRFPAMRSCGGFFDRDLTIMANFGSRGWKHVKDGTPLSDAELKVLGKRIYDALPAGMIRMEAGSRDAGMVMMSGLDCNPSAVLEADLIGKGIGYRILPSVLDTDNLKYSRAVACATDPASAWKGARQGEPIDRPAEDCRFDAVAAHDISCMFTALPAVLFADGAHLVGTEAIDEILSRHAPAGQTGSPR